jgi:DNA-binding NarL/FixJ family response regulator
MWSNVDEVCPAEEASAPMHRIILADDQVIFRAGTARVLAQEDDMRIIAQCEDSSRLLHTIRSFQSAVAVFSSGLKVPLTNVIAELKKVGSYGILVAEKDEEIPRELAAQLGAIVGRTVSPAVLIDCVRRVGRGQRCLTAVPNRAVEEEDVVGAKVRDRLTPKEMQIVALIVQGCKNKDIAEQLGTKEQVIKNYLRSIYDKIGVSDRLELALFTLHHRLLKQAAVKAGEMIQRKIA